MGQRMKDGRPTRVTTSAHLEQWAKEDTKTYCRLTVFDPSSIIYDTCPKEDSTNELIGLEEFLGAVSQKRAEEGTPQDGVRGSEWWPDDFLPEGGGGGGAGAGTGAGAGAAGRSSGSALAPKPTCRNNFNVSLKI